MQYDNPTKAQKKRIKVQNIPQNLPIDLYLDEDDLPSMPPLEGNKNDRLVFKIKDGYKLELQTPETIKLFGSTKKLIDQLIDKKWRKGTKT